ncbi:MAG TPA: hypothetical protein ENH01_02125 [Nitrospirae bacterium]|nr:hypothetical protein [Nitrospirota bacterium]
MNQKTKGAWIIHHCYKLQGVTNAPNIYDQLLYSGKCGVILNALASSDEREITNKRVNTLAKAAGISVKLELPSILEELERQKLIDSGSKSIQILGLTTSETLEHSATIYDESEPTKEENVAINLSEKVSDLPIKSKDACEKIEDKYHITSIQCKNLINEFESIGFIDSENAGKDDLLFNGNLFRRKDIQKVNGVLSSLTHAEESKVRDLMAMLESNGCISYDLVLRLTGSKLLAKLVSISFIDVNKIGNESGIFAFITRPAAFKKYSNSLVDDAFDLAKAFVTSVTYGMTIRSSSQGRIRMVERLMKKLIDGAWVGPATAIGQDYRVLELKGVIEVCPSRDVLYSKLN